MNYKQQKHQDIVNVMTPQKEKKWLKSLPIYSSES